MVSLILFSLFLLSTVILIITADEDYWRYVLVFIYVFASVTLLILCNIFGRFLFINPSWIYFYHFFFIILTMFYIARLDVDFEADSDCSHLTPERKQKIVFVASLLSCA